MLSATRDGAELVGKSVEEIFFRTPIIPDEIHMDASSDSVIALVFCQETINGVKYPERVLYLKNGIVVRAITDGEVATEHD